MSLLIMGVKEFAWSGLYVGGMIFSIIFVWAHLLMPETWKILDSRIGAKIESLNPYKGD